MSCVTTVLQVVLKSPCSTEILVGIRGFCNHIKGLQACPSAGRLLSQSIGDLQSCRLRSTPLLYESECKLSILREVLLDCDQGGDRSIRVEISSLCCIPPNVGQVVFILCLTRSTERSCVDLRALSSVSEHSGLCLLAISAMK